MSDNSLIKLDIDYPDYSQVTPLTSLYICRGVTLTNSYNNCILFSNEQEQLEFFTRKKKYEIKNMTPISLQKPIRVPFPADSLYDCNYIFFTNDNFSVKFIFCFISGIEYINLNVSAISFEIDVMQTWMFQIHLNPCLIERQHAYIDAPGLNTLGENIPLGDYKRVSRIRAGTTNNKGVMVTLPADVNQDDYNKLNGGVFSGLEQRVIKVENNAVPPIQDLLQSYINEGREGDIIAIQMVPYDFVTQRGEEKPIEKKISISGIVDEIDGYRPKNKKLLQYPYIYLEIDNTQGQIGVFKFEFFKSDICEFRIIGMTNGDSPEIILYPLNYDGMGDNIMEQMSLSGFPQCSWSGDTYKAYLANNSIKNATNLGSAVISAGAALATGNIAAAALTVPSAVNYASGLENYNPLFAQTQKSTTMRENMSKKMSNMAVLSGMIRAGSGLTNTAGNYMQEMHNAEIAENKVRGTRGSDVLYSDDLMDFWITIKNIDASHAKAIDDYWTRFGYRIDSIEVPNITSRKSWNYVKTVESNISGNIPFDHIEIINQIFNHGVTFWHGDYIGDFRRDNSIV